MMAVSEISAPKRAMSAEEVASCSLSQDENSIPFRLSAEDSRAVFQLFVAAF